MQTCQGFHSVGVGRHEPRSLFADYLQVRQCVLKFLATLIGDSGKGDVESSELPKRLKMNQAGIGNLGAMKVEPLEGRQWLKMQQAGVGHLRAFEIEVFESTHTSKMQHPRIGEVPSSKAEIFEMVHSFKNYQAGIANPMVPERQMLKSRQPLEVR